MNSHQQPIETWTREQCEDYLNKYPKSLNSDAVRKRYEMFRPEIEKEKRKKEANEEREFWNSHNYTREGLVEYMKKYPNGRFMELCDDSFWQVSKYSLQGMEEYKQLFPQGSHIADTDRKKVEFAEQRKQQIANQKAQENNEKILKKIIKGIGMLLCIAASIIIIVITIDKGFWEIFFALGPVGWIGSKIMNWKID